MILGLTVISDQATGYRAPLFDKRWEAVQAQFAALAFPWAKAIRIMITLGDVEEALSVVGLEGPGRLVINIDLSRAKTYEMLIQEVNDLLINRIFDALDAAYDHFKQTPPAELKALRQQALERKPVSKNASP